MRVIDAHSGREVKRGDVLWNGHDRNYQIITIEPGIFSARMRIAYSDGKQAWIPLQVRWTHPSYFLQYVAFIPS
jgi:hypothetical protein